MIQKANFNICKINNSQLIEICESWCRRKNYQLTVIRLNHPIFENVNKVPMVVMTLRYYGPYQLFENITKSNSHTLYYLKERIDIRNYNTVRIHYE